MSHPSEGGDAVDRMLNEIENLLKRQQDGVRVRPAARTNLEATMDEDRTAQALDEADAVRPPHDGGEPPRVRELIGENDVEDSAPPPADDNGADRHRVTGERAAARPVGALPEDGEESPREPDEDDFDPDALAELETYDPEQVVREIRTLRSREVRAADGNGGTPAENSPSADLVAVDPSRNGDSADSPTEARSAANESVSPDTAARSADESVDSDAAITDNEPPDVQTANEVDLPVEPPRTADRVSGDLAEPRMPTRAADEPLPPRRPAPDAQSDFAGHEGKARSVTHPPTAPDPASADDRSGATHAADTGHATREPDDGIHMTRRLTTRLGQLLVDADMLSQQQLAAALRRQQETGERLGSVLVDQGYIDESTLLFVLERQYGVPAVKLDEVELDAELAKLIPHDLARHSLVVPLATRADAIDVAMVDPTDFVAMAHVRVAAGVRPNVFITTAHAARRAIARLYGEGAGQQTAGERLAPREAIKRMILDRDAVLLAADGDPREFYDLAASIDRFVDDLMRKAQSES